VSDLVENFSRYLQEVQLSLTNRMMLALQRSPVSVW